MRIPRRHFKKAATKRVDAGVSKLFVSDLKPTEETESKLQIRLVKKMREMNAKGANINFFAVPNGGYRSKKTAQIMFLEGLESGVPDLIFINPRHGFTGMAIEMKRGKKGVLSDNQKKWLPIFKKNGWYVKVIRNEEDFFKVLNAYYSESGNLP